MKVLRVHWWRILAAVLIGWGIQTLVADRERLEEKLVVQRAELRSLRAGQERLAAAHAELVRDLEQARPGHPPGERVKVEWMGGWYPGEVLASRPNRRLIHYTGYCSSWNAWVPMARIRRE